MPRVTNTDSFSYYYQKAYKYAAPVTKRYYTWIKKGCSRAYSKLPRIMALAKRHIVQTSRTAGIFLWQHRQVVVRGIVIIAALTMVYYLWKNRPQFPITILKTSLNFAKLQIKILEEERVSPNATLVFCIDKSKSMAGDREATVKRAVKRVLESAHRLIKGNKEAKIGIAVVTFDTSAQVIIPATNLSSDPEEKEQIQNQVDGISSGGGTSILAGLEQATNQLESIVKGNTTGGSYALILLTDGENSLDSNRLVSLQKRIAAVNAQLFAIGIERHSKGTLQTVVRGNEEGFKATYIDTTEGEATIEGAIAEIYGKAIACFRDVKLTVSHMASAELEKSFFRTMLENIFCAFDARYAISSSIPFFKKTFTTKPLAQELWSLREGASYVETNGQKEYDLGALSEKEEREVVLEIHAKQLKEPLDLSTVIVKVTFTDPKGRKGYLTFPWRPDAIIKPEVLG